MYTCSRSVPERTRKMERSSLSVDRTQTGVFMKKLIFITTILICAGAANLRAEVRAFPVPWVAKQSGPNIVFTDLPGSGSIKIYTVAGEEVINLPIPSGANQLQWAVVNSSGRKVASGVYFYLVEGGGAEKKGKLIVIR